MIAFVNHLAAISCPDGPGSIGDSLNSAVIAGNVFPVGKP